MRVQQKNTEREREAKGGGEYRGNRLPSLEIDGLLWFYCNSCAGEEEIQIVGKNLRSIAVCHPKPPPYSRNSGESIPRTCDWNSSNRSSQPPPRNSAWAAPSLLALIPAFSVLEGRCLSWKISSFHCLGLSLLFAAFALNLVGGSSPFILNTYVYDGSAFDLNENAATGKSTVMEYTFRFCVKLWISLQLAFVSVLGKYCDNQWFWVQLWWVLFCNPDKFVLSNLCFLCSWMFSN